MSNRQKAIFLLFAAFFTSIFFAWILKQFLSDWLAAQSPFVNGLVWLVFCLPSVLMAARAVSIDKATK